MTCVSVPNKTCPRSQSLSYVCTRLVFRALPPRVCTMWRLWPCLEVDTSSFGQEVWFQNWLRRKYANHVWRNLQCHETETETETNHEDIGMSTRSKGPFIAHTEVKGQLLFHFNIVVVSAKANNRLSRSVASRMGFILKVDEFEEPFNYIGYQKTEPVTIVLRGGAEPHALSVAWRVQIPLQPKVKEELDRLQAAAAVAAVIVPITKPTSWCAPMEPVMTKSGKVRICVDVQKRNEEVKL